VRLSWLEARDFRNHQDVRLEISPGLTAVAGPNGEGKTNLLEAMYYLTALVTPRVSNDLPLVRTGASSAYLRGEVEALGGRFLIEVEIRSTGANRVLVNRSAVRRKRDLHAKVRAVFSGPDDLAVVLGDPSERRRFMDQAVGALWPVKEGVASAYERALRQRNRLLKDWQGEGDPSGLEAWDAELALHGSALTALRAQAVDAIREAAADEFRTLTGEAGDPLVVEYRPSVEGEPLEDAFLARLAERKTDELIRRTTLVGPHRDDLGLTVERLAARGFASHGEAWGTALALRLALARAVAKEVGENPILFLDDPFSGLDPARRQRVSATLDRRGQVLIAVPDRAQAPVGASIWCLREGRIDREEA
jgi:DNA replication and repair protein RecF